MPKTLNRIAELEKRLPGVAHNVPLAPYTTFKIGGPADYFYHARTKEGLTKAIAERPDAIVLDLMMPEMDGIAFLRRLRMHPETETIPVVILTAKTYLVELGQLDHLGVAGAIAKPFNPLELPTQIARALQWHAAIDA